MVWLLGVYPFGVHNFRFREHGTTGRTGRTGRTLACSPFVSWFLVMRSCMMVL